MRLTNPTFFGQSLISGLNFLTFYKIGFTLCNMVILKKKFANQEFDLKLNETLCSHFHPILRCTQKVAFKIAKWLRKFSSTSFPFVAQNCGYTTPMAIITPCGKKWHCKFSIKPWAMPSHSSFTLLMVWLKTLQGDRFFFLALSTRDY